VMAKLESIKNMCHTYKKFPTVVHTHASPITISFFTTFLDMHLATAYQIYSLPFFIKSQDLL